MNKCDLCKEGIEENIKMRTVIMTIEERNRTVKITMCPVCYYKLITGKKIIRWI